MLSNSHARVAIITLLFVAGATTRFAPNMLSTAAPQVRRTTRYYELRAPSIAELVTEFRAVAGTGTVPVRFGLTKWDVKLDASSSFGTRTSCATERVTLRVTLTTTLPKAVGSAHFTSEDATEWQRFLPALLRHEAQHDSIVVTNATAFLLFEIEIAEVFMKVGIGSGETHCPLQVFLREVETAANHGEMPTSIEQCVTALVERIERANTTFDAVTQHGGTDGAALRVLSGARRGSPGL